MNTAKKGIKRAAKDFYLVLILTFLYVPILTMMILSFNSSKSRTQWGGFILKWYGQVFESITIMDALGNMLLIASVSALMATIIDTAVSIAINNMKQVPRSIVMGITNTPMLNVDIATGTSLMLAFIAFGISLEFKTILTTHITFNIPYMTLNAMPKLKQTNKSTYEATMDLGASPIYTLFKVVSPDILPGALSSFLPAFTMSLNDFIITHFAKSAGTNILSTLVYGKARGDIRPSMYSPFTVIFLAVLILLLITGLVPNRKKGEK